MSPAPVDEKPPATRGGKLKRFFDDRLGLEGLRALGKKKTVPLHVASHFYFLG